MAYWENYHRATNIEDALQALTGAPGSACPIAGGTDLLIDIQQGRHSPIHTLVDVTAIPELRRLELRKDNLFIGAAVPLNELIRSPLVVENAQALVEACSLIGGPQVRNTATLGGNVAHSLPAGDGTIALLALDAIAEVADLSGLRRLPLGELFRGPGKSALDLNRELIVGFYLPQRRLGEASSFVRVMRPQGVALPILNLAAWVSRQADHLVDVRLVIGPAGPTPRRALQTEAHLRKEGFAPDRVDEALEILLGEVQLRTSPYRASAVYRRELVGPLLTEGLVAAWSRAGDR